MLEKLVKKSNLNDVFIILITSIAMIAIWRGMWGLMDLYLIPENYLFSQIASVILGITILLIMSEIK